MEERDDGRDLVRDHRVEFVTSSPSVPGYSHRGQDAPYVRAQRDGPPPGQRAREPGPGDDDAERAVDRLGKGAGRVVVRRVDGDLCVDYYFDVFFIS